MCVGSVFVCVCFFFSRKKKRVRHSYSSTSERRRNTEKYRKQQCFGFVFLFLFSSSFFFPRLFFFVFTLRIDSTGAHTHKRGPCVYLYLYKKSSSCCSSLHIIFSQPPSLPPSDRFTHTSICTSLPLILFFVLGRGARGRGGVLARCHFPLLESACIVCWGLFFFSSLLFSSRSPSRSLWICIDFCVVFHSSRSLWDEYLFF